MNSKLSNLLKPVSLNAVVVLMLATCCLFLHVKNFVHSWAIFLTLSFVDALGFTPQLLLSDEFSHSSLKTPRHDFKE